MENIDLVEKFGKRDVRIIGSREEPLLNCADVIKHLLGYKDFSDCSAWNQLKDNPKYVLVDLTSGKAKRYFTGRGAYEIVSLSKRKNAEIIKDWMYDVIDRLRLGKITTISAQLEEAKQKIAELTGFRPASIYKIYEGQRLLYVGKDKSKKQNRP